MKIEGKVGNWLRAVRLEKKMTQETLAKCAGIERTFISHIEKGKRNISLDTLEKILGGLEISMKSFFSTEKFE